MQDAGARRVSNAEGMHGIVRKHDCALPAQYTKHSNARGHSLGFGSVFVLVLVVVLGLVLVLVQIQNLDVQMVHYNYASHRPPTWHEVEGPIQDWIRQGKHLLREAHICSGDTGGCMGPRV